MEQCSHRFHAPPRFMKRDKRARHTEDTLWELAALFVNCRSCEACTHARLAFVSFSTDETGLFGTVLMEEGLEGRKEEASLFLLEDFRVFVFLLPRGGGWLEVELPVFCRDRLKAYTHVSRG